MKYMRGLKHLKVGNNKMEKLFRLEIVTPDKIFLKEEVSMIVVNTDAGKVGILKNHAPMMFAVTPGVIKVRKDNEDRKAFVSEGFMEVNNNVVTLMVDAAEWPEEIDINRALQAKQRAEERLKRKLAEKEYINSKAALLRAIERINITKKGN